MADWKRIGVVTAGLSAAGAVVTALLAVALSGAATLVLDGYESARSFLSEFVLEIALAGALYGAVLGPAAAWLLMRRVPLGLALAGTSLGTTAGTVVAMATGLDGRVCVVLGFFLSALALRWVVARRGPAPVSAAVSGG